MARQTATKLKALELTDNLVQSTTVTTKATAGAVTYTVAEFTGGLILRDPAGAAREDVTPTAAALYTELGDPAVGGTFDVVIRNTADADETITMTAGTGVTISGTATIGQNNTKIFRCVFTSPSAVTMYSIGTLVH